MPTGTPLHQVDPPALTVGAQATIDAGDLTFEAVGGPTSEPHVISVYGVQVLRCDATAAFMVDTTGPTTLLSVDLTAAVVLDTTNLTDSPVWSHTDAVSLDASTGTLVVTVLGQAFPLTLTPGVHAIVAVANATGTFVVVDGALEATGAAPAMPAGDYSYLRSACGADLYSVALWNETSTVTEAEDLSSSLLPSDLHAMGGWGMAGTATLTTDDPWETPAPGGLTPGGAQTPPTPPTPADPPLGVPDPVLRRLSEVMPTPTLDDRGNPVDWAATETIAVPYARLQVVVEGVDITYWDDVPIPVPTWDRQEPFGSGTASIQLPQLTAFHALPAWCKAGANVQIRLARLDDTVSPRFTGVLMSFGHRADDGVFTLECVGVVFADDFQLRQPAFLTAPRDIGHVVAEVLNATVSKRHTDVAPVTTGCLTGVLGGWEPKITGYVTQLLATAVTGGRQWTVRCDDRSPALVLKDTTTIAWTVHNGQRGVQIDLVQDYSQAPNVIYASGVGPDGGRWQNAMYPNWSPDDTPPYPFTNPATLVRVGTTDAQTDTGNGISLWQAKAGQPVTGVFSLADRARLRVMQAAAGIQVDGSLGPQSWAATFDTGANTGTLDCFYMPVAFSPEVMPRAYGPDGDDLGPNPSYDPGVIRVEDKIDFGQGASKTMGVRAAQEMHARGVDPGWIGTVMFELDPQETSRYEIQEGSNGLIRGFRGQDLVVHVAKVDYGETVTVTVDTKARDFPTLDAILERERNATDPAKALVKRLTRGTLSTDRATFDAESPAGQLPRHAVFSNLWDVRRIPFGAYGSIVRSEITTDGPARAFSMAVFDRPITAAGLLAIVGNPLTAEQNPWSEHGEALDAAGLLMAWGWAKQPLGYWPGEFNTPDGESEDPLTGRFVDDASWEYASQQVPWLWVATIASGSCYVGGRFWPGVD